MSPAGGATEPGEVLRVEDLAVTFEADEGPLRAVDGASFAVPRGGTVALVGESGCGKTATALAILRLLPPEGRVAGGRVLLDGTDLLGLSEREMRAVRGRRIAMVFQEPLTALNPVLTIGAQIAEAIRAHERVPRREARERAVELLRKVRIADPGARAGQYPHQLSGGMRQRAMIAVALAGGPSLLIADEPTTALDATVEGEILDLLADLKAELGMAVLLITHDLALADGFADRVAVLYAGQVVEAGPVKEVFAGPLHPYTRGLLASVPRPESRGRPLPVIHGTVPDPRRFPPGCRFHPRCDGTVPGCAEEEPPLAEKGPGRLVRCRTAGGGKP